MAAAGPITVVPLWLTIGGVPARDGERSLAEVVGRLGDGVTTSGPTPGELAAAIAGADQGAGVVVLTLSREMSSTYGAARLAVGMVPDTPTVLLDTGSAAGGEGLVVLAAARAAATGASLDAVAAAARRAADAVRLVATLPTLDHLARSGRVPGAAAWAGRWLGVNPLFEFRAGRIRPLRPARGPRAAQERIVARWLEDLPDPAERGRASLHVAAMHALDPAAADALLEEVGRRVAPASAFVAPFSPVMVAHTGPGLVGLAWWWERPEPAGAG